MLRDDSDTNDSRLGREQVQLTVGDAGKMKALFDTLSPVHQAALIKSPIFVAHGDWDGRVPVEHSEKLVAALKANRKSHEWLLLPGEGHGIWRPANHKRYYEALFAFFDRHIGAGAAATAPPAASAPR